MDLKAKLWLEFEGKPLMGEGRARLLELIDERGSISGGARDLGLSYRHAWGIVGDIEKILGENILKSRRGGKGGGGTHLTERGKMLLREFREKEAIFKKCLIASSFDL